jgi:hypothetical protein
MAHAVAVWPAAPAQVVHQHPLNAASDLSVHAGPRCPHACGCRMSSCISHIMLYYVIGSALVVQAPACSSEQSLDELHAGLYCTVVAQCGAQPHA